MHSLVKVTSNDYGHVVCKLFDPTGNSEQKSLLVSIMRVSANNGAGAINGDYGIAKPSTRVSGNGSCDTPNKGRLACYAHGNGQLGKSPTMPSNDGYSTASLNLGAIIGQKLGRPYCVGVVPPKTKVLVNSSGASIGMMGFGKSEQAVIKCK